MRVFSFFFIGFALVGCAQQGTEPAAGVAPAPAATAVAAPLGSVKPQARTQIPLPPGNWVALARRERLAGHNVNGDTNVDTSAAMSFALVEDGTIKAYLVVGTNTFTSPGQAYALSEYCRLAPKSDDPTVFFQKFNGPSYDNEDCLKIRTIRLTRNRNDPFSVATWKTAEPYGTFPRDGIQVYFGAVGGGNFLNYGLIRFPERDGGPPGPWQARAPTPQQAAYIQSLKDWAEAFRPRIIDGTRNRLPAT